MIEIDGSKYEGGGQILRTATSLSALTGKPCRVFNIRQKRPKPGLAHQHLLGLKALAQLCNGKIKGDYLGSKQVEFYPGSNCQDRISINIPTAGSITLVLQSLTLPVLYSPIPIKISFNGGATDTFFSPTIDYFRYVFLEILEKILEQTDSQGKPHINLNIEKRGFYPEGGAKITIEVFPSTLRPFSLKERGSLETVLVISGASDYLKKQRVAERQISGAKQVLGKLKLPIEEKIEYYSTNSAGSQINIIAKLKNTVFGADNLGKLGKSAEQVGKEAAQDFLEEVRSNACLDKHLADQVLPYMALAPGRSEVTVSKITSHCQTNIWVIEQFIKGKFEIQDNLITWKPKTNYQVFSTAVKNT